MTDLDQMLAAVQAAAESHRAALQERQVTIAAARTAGVPLRIIAECAGLSVTRVHELAAR